MLPQRRDRRAVQVDRPVERMGGTPGLARFGFNFGRVVRRRSVKAGEEAGRGREERGIWDERFPGVLFVSLCLSSSPGYEK